MSDLYLRFSALRRPRLMVRAARFGLDDYRRERDLKRVLKSSSVPTTSRAVDLLLNEEARLEEARLIHETNYNIVRHVDVLICLMAEVQLLAPPATKKPAHLSVV